MSLSAATSYATLVRVTSKPVGDLVPPSSPTQRLTKYATVTLAAQRWAPLVKPNAADAESPGPGGRSAVPPTTPAKSPGGGEDHSPPEMHSPSTVMQPLSPAIDLASAPRPKQHRLSRPTSAIALGPPPASLPFASGVQFEHLSRGYRGPCLSVAEARRELERATSDARQQAALERTRARLAPAWEAVHTREEARQLG